MLRKIVLTGIVALVAAVPELAGEGKPSGGKELRISGPVVRASAQALSVENLVGDAVLTCAVPDRLAEKAAALKPGDKIRMVCVRHKGRKAELVKIERLGEKAKTGRREEGRGEEGRREAAAEKQEAAGQVAELGAAVDRRPGARQAPRVPRPGREAGEARGPKVGDKVKIALRRRTSSRASSATAPRKPAGEEVRLYGKIVVLSRAAVTVQGEAGCAHVRCRRPRC